MVIRGFSFVSERFVNSEAVVQKPSPAAINQKCNHGRGGKESGGSPSRQPKNFCQKQSRSHAQKQNILDGLPSGTKDASYQPAPD